MNRQEKGCRLQLIGIVSLIKSKTRVTDHGEVFTPPWLVDAMLDLVKGETERIDARFLEPACGSGNFLVHVLKRKLAAVERKFGKSEFEKTQYALLGLMCICLLYTSPSPRDRQKSRMPSSA